MNNYALLTFVTFIFILMNQTPEAVFLPKSMQIKKALKEWNKYTLKAIASALSTEIRNTLSTNVPSMSSLLERGHRKFQTMLNVSKNRYIGAYFPSMVAMRKPLGKCQKTMEFNTKPLGKDEEQIFIRKPGYPLYLSYTFTWFFDLDWKLELNLTIHRTYLSSYLSSKCIFGNLTLLPFLSEFAHSRQFFKNRFKILKITDKIDPVFLLQLAALSESQNLDKVKIELFMRTDLSSNNLVQRYDQKGKLFPVIYESVKGKHLAKPHLWYRSLHWKSNMRFSKNNIFHLVSLPGDYEKVRITLQGVVGYEN